jgi:hypothetical protein
VTCSRGAPALVWFGQDLRLSDNPAVAAALERGSYDLDTETAAVCRKMGVNLVRATTVGVHPAFVSMIRELILERTSGQQRRELETAGPGCDSCEPECCLVTGSHGRLIRTAGASARA